MRPSIDQIPFFFAQLRLLRVLDMQGSLCLTNKNLVCICRFFQLKYLSLRNTSVSILPRLIGNLDHLETLDIRETPIKKLPSSAANLTCLKHLFAGYKTQLTRTASVKFLRPASGLEMSHGMVKNMASLHSLVHVEIKEHPSVFQEIGLLQNLRKLGVLFYGVEVYWKPFLELLSNLSGSLRSLSIDIFEAQGNSSCSSLEMLSSLVSPPIFITSFSLTGKLDSLPPWIASLRNVSRLTLRNSQLHADAIQVLGGLQNLLCLKLYHKSYDDDHLVFPQGKFPRVKLLIIDNLMNLEKLHFKEGSVPNLERLTLSFLREPKDGISGLNNFLKLREAEFFGNIISSVVNKVVSCVKEHQNNPRVVGDKWNIVTVYKGAVRSLLCKLGRLLTEETWLVQGVHGEIQYIKDELECMNAFLHNLTISEIHDDQVRIWMKQVREIAYDSEDCIDEFTHNLGESSEMGFFRGIISILRKIACRHRIAVQLQELKARAQDVGERRSRYGVELSNATHQEGRPRLMRHTSLHLDPQLHALFAEEAQLVGIDDPRDELVGWLMEEDPRLRVLAIVGFGGLGKTTLARMVCRSPVVKSADFQCCPLFIVSQIFNIRTLFQHMVRELIQEPHKAMAIAGTGSKYGLISEDYLEGMERWEVTVLTKNLRRYFQDKRFIVILDDIWTVSAWESIKCAIPDNFKGSRIIVTTRNADVANTCCSHPQDRIYNIQRLSDTTSRELFFKKIFGFVDNKSPNDELEEVSNSILKKCGGLPLAIVNIGSLLASKKNRTKEEWQKVCNNLGSELENNPTLEGVKQVLTLSYNDLPYHLKACFLYLSIFPENYVIKRGPLVRRWIAEGFISQRHGQSMEQLAESYFDEFVTRSMVQPVRTDWTGKVRSCRVHDLMLDVIVSRSIEENFASFLCDNLKYLSLRNTNTPKLPQLLGNLKHLETLDIRATLIKKLPSSAGNLSCLKHLLVGHKVQLTRTASVKYLRPESGLEVTTGVVKNMKALQSLVHIVVKDNSPVLQEIGLLQHLRKLNVLFRGAEQNWKAFLESLSKLPGSLRSLSIHILDEKEHSSSLDNLTFVESPPLFVTSFSLMGKLQFLPPWISSLRNVSRLTLRSTGLHADAIGVLGDLPNLLCLKLYHKSYADDCIIFRRGKFAKLKLLIIDNLERIEKVQFEAGSVSNLERLTLSFLREPKHGISGLENLTKLKEIEFFGDIILSVVTKVASCVKTHPNHPRVIGDKWNIVTEYA
uniref:NB-ARC domain-containing protein n=1 Tax=Leersia perrieri TaxID=77586 RepID=A0A0D9WM57_9ORYZ